MKLTISSNRQPRCSWTSFNRSPSHEWSSVRGQGPYFAIVKCDVRPTYAVLLEGADQSSERQALRRSRPSRCRAELLDCLSVGTGSFALIRTKNSARASVPKIECEFVCERGSDFVPLAVLVTVRGLEH